jgi:hypothetical protein
LELVELSPEKRNQYQVSFGLSPSPNPSNVNHEIFSIGNHALLANAKFSLISSQSPTYRAKSVAANPINAPPSHQHSVAHKPSQRDTLRVTIAIGETSEHFLSFSHSVLLFFTFFAATLRYLQALHTNMDANTHPKKETRLPLLAMMMAMMMMIMMWC